MLTGFWGSVLLKGRKTHTQYIRFSTGPTRGRDSAAAGSVIVKCVSVCVKADVCHRRNLHFLSVSGRRGNSES